MCVCVCITVCVCLYSVCASTTDVAFLALWFELLCVQGFCVESCQCVKLCVSKRKSFVKALVSKRHQRATMFLRKGVCV